MNRVFVSGNLSRDCELRSTQGGTQILTFGIAVNDRKRDPQSGEWVDVPNTQTIIYVDKVVTED